MSSAKSFDVAIILVGLNARDYVRGCLQSLERAEWRDVTYECVYVDNGSTDDSVTMVRNEFPTVRVIANPTNVGYCPAANQGVAETQARYIYLLNDDTIVLGDAIALLVETMDRMPECGTMGSRLLYPDGSEQWSGRRFPTLLYALFGRKSWLASRFPNAKPVREYLCKDQLKGSEPFEVDWVSAAGQIVRRDAFETVGGLAEDYYYWHETVFCDRLKNKGYKVMLHPLSKVIHYEGKGSGKRPYKVQKFHIINFNQGAFRCFCEHYRLGPWDLRRYLAAALLSLRAAVQLTVCRLQHLRQS
jgi:GT2 family glycosyltransferase